MAQAALGCVGVQRYTHKIRRHSAFFVTLLSDYNYQLNDNGVPKGSKRTTATPFLSSDNSKICISLARSDIRDISGIDLVIFKIEVREDTMTPLDHQAERTTRKKVYDSSSFYKKAKKLSIDIERSKSLESSFRLKRNLTNKLSVDVHNPNRNGFMKIKVRLI